VVDVDLAGNRRLMLRHTVVKGAQLSEADAKRVLQHLADLWSYDVSLVEVDAADNVLKEYVLNPSARRSSVNGCRRISNRLTNVCS
jgi:spore cortex formation protein SpoVR/YcgB (stage V sporulation)